MAVSGSDTNSPGDGIRLLGGVSIVADGEVVDAGGPRQRAVLALLAAAEGRSVAIERLIDELWADRTPGGPRRTVQTYVSNLRKVLARVGGTIDRDGAAYRLVIDDDRLDLARYQRTVRDADAATQPETQLALRRSAAAQWDHPFDGVAETRRLNSLTAELSGRHIENEVARLRLEAEFGDAQAAVAALEAMIAETPWNTDHWVALFEVHATLGRVADLDATIDSAREAYSRDGTEVPSSLVQRYRALRSDRPHREYSDGAAGDAGVPALPPPIASQLRTRIVGRADELAAAAPAIAGPGLQLAVIEGEAGVGKTHIAAQLAADAHERGWCVLYGRADETHDVPLRVVLETVDLLADAVSAEHVTRLAGPTGDELGGLSPRFGTPRPSTDPELQLHWIATAMSDLLGALAERCGRVLWVVDDLQWADPGFVGVVDHLHRRDPEAPISILATLRSTAGPARGDLATTLHEFRAAARLSRISVDGLDLDAVSRLVGTARGEEVLRYTQGNALFVTEVARQIEAGAEIRAGEYLQDVVRSRVRGLDDDATDILEYASLLGREIRVDLIAASSNRSVEEVASALDAATDRGLLQGPESGQPWYEFRHVLVRDATRDSIPAGAAAIAHRAIATALDDRAGTDVASAIERAHHWLRAVPTGAEREAIDALRTAAGRAGATPGRAVAVELLRGAADLAPGAGCDPAEWSTIDIELAEACAVAGLPAPCLDAAERAAERAASAGLDDLVVRAAVATTGGDALSDMFSGPRARALIARALPLVDVGSETWTLLTSKDLSLQVWDRRSHDLRAEFAELLDEMPSTIAPAPARQVAENACYIAAGDVQQRCVDMLARAIEPDDPASRLPLLYEQLQQSLSVGDGDVFRNTLEHYGPLAEGNALHEFACASGRATVRFWHGSWRAAMREAVTASERVHAARPMATDSSVLSWITTLAWFGDHPFIVRSPAERHFATYRAAYFDAALIWEAVERSDHARLDRRARQHGEAYLIALTLPRLAGVGLWPFVAAAGTSGDPGVIGYASEMLEAIDPSTAVLAMPHQPLPAMSHLRAWLSVGERRHEEAIVSLEDAIDVYLRLGARPYLAAAQAELAVSLAAVGRREAAQANASQALAAAREMRLRRPSRVARSVLGVEPAAR